MPSWSMVQSGHFSIQAAVSENTPVGVGVVTVTALTDITTQLILQVVPHM